MKAYLTTSGIIIDKDSTFYLLKDLNWDQLIMQDNLTQFLADKINASDPINNALEIIENEILAPIGRQEVWAAGVTYFRSKSARMEESKDAGGGDFYDRVYAAERPEIFFKSTAYRTVGNKGNVRIRKDSTWDVPEPELTLLVNPKAEIVGYTIGNDMSSRSIEGENPLYLPQAKSYDKSASLGPCIWFTNEIIPAETKISLDIIRNGKTIFNDSTSVSQMKRKLPELVSYLFRECSFEYGCFLMTGTGIIPPNEFTLQSGDEIRISIDKIGTLINYVE